VLSKISPSSTINAITLSVITTGSIDLIGVSTGAGVGSA
jgi:hypothetical protein